MSAELSNHIIFVMTFVAWVFGPISLFVFLIRITADFSHFLATKKHREAPFLRYGVVAVVCFAWICSTW